MVVSCPADATLLRGGGSPQYPLGEARRDPYPYPYRESNPDSFIVQSFSRYTDLNMSRQDN
jgi:hypothetical protein